MLLGTILTDWTKPSEKIFMDGGWMPWIEPWPGNIWRLSRKEKLAKEAENKWSVRLGEKMGYPGVPEARRREFNSFHTAEEWSKRKKSQQWFCGHGGCQWLWWVISGVEYDPKSYWSGRKRTKGEEVEKELSNSSRYRCCEDLKLASTTRVYGNALGFVL